MKRQSKEMIEVYQKKSKMELEDLHPNKLNFRAIYKTSMNASYVNKCIENIARRSEEKTLTKFITYTQKGMQMLLVFWQSCNTT